MSERFETTTLIEEMAALDPEVAIEFHVREWHPLSNGEGRPAQVHLCAEIPGVVRFAMRLKSKEAMDEFIAKLQEHRNKVWGDT